MKPIRVQALRSRLLQKAVTGGASSGIPTRSAESTIAPGSNNHHDLSSFVAYAERVKLAPGCTVYVGTHYEYTVAATLARLGFHLTRTGCSSDLGIDLRGTWALPFMDEPARPTRLRVLVQCKARNSIVNPRHIRELEGAFTGVPSDWCGDDFLGLLATTKKATKGVIEALGRSRWPMGFLKIDPDGRVEQFLWNGSARTRGLEGLGVTLRYMVNEQGADGEVKSDIALTWQGKSLPYAAFSEGDALPPSQMEEDGQNLSIAASENVSGQEAPEPAVRRKRGRPRKNPVK